MKAEAPWEVSVAGTSVRAMGVEPPFMSIPPRPSEASGTWERWETFPVPRSLLTMSAWSVPLPPLIRTVGRLIVRSSSLLPSGFRWPVKCTPPEKPELSAPVSGS